MNEQRPWEGHAILPLLVVDNLEHLPATLEALVSGGISIVEIGLRTSVGLEAISLARQIKGLTVGAGTILDTRQAEAAREAGAQFGVSPSSHPEIMSWARKHQWPYMPGVATPTEAHRASDAGFTDLKVYPANLLGGVAFIDALHAVLPTLRFMPSGGVNHETARDYLAHPAVCAVSGSWLTPRGALNSGDIDSIRKLITSWRVR